MKTFFILLTILLITSICCSQTKSDMVGMWKIIGQPSGLKDTKAIVSYLELKEDGTYIWGIDSTSDNPVKTVAKGNWELTEDKDIKLKPNDDKARFYTKRGDKYEYDGYEENGQKVHEIVLEMSIAIQKCDN